MTFETQKTITTTPTTLYTPKQDLGRCPSDLGDRLRVRRRRGLGRPQLRTQLATAGPSVGGAPLRRALLLQLHTGVATVAHCKREVIRNLFTARCEVL